MAEIEKNDEAGKPHIVRIKESTFRRVWRYRRMMEMPSCREVPIGEVLDRLVSMALDPLDGNAPLDEKDAPE